MILEMPVPSPGESISEVEIAQWLVKDGDYVDKDQTIAEVDSDKATLDLPAQESGIITLFKVEYKPIIIEDTMPVTEKQKEELFYQNLIRKLPKIYMYENQEIPEYVRYTLNKMENTYKGEASKNQKIKISYESEDKILIQFNPRLYDEIKEENQKKITE